jgi:hypothetical protein
VKHFASPDFWAHYQVLPEPIQKLADRNFKLLKSNLNHPSLRFKKVRGTAWSVRIGDDYRTLGKFRSEGIVGRGSGLIRIMIKSLTHKI